MSKSIFDQYYPNEALDYAGQLAGLEPNPVETTPMGDISSWLSDLNQTMGGPVLDRMQAHGDNQMARRAAGDYSPTRLNDDTIGLADDVAGGLLGPIGAMGAMTKKAAKKVIPEKDIEGDAITYRHPTTYELHREDGPAMIFEDGSKSWYKEGLPHRSDGGPADHWIGEAGKHFDDTWYYEGYLHNKNGPAQIRKDSKTGQVLHEKYAIGDIEMDKADFDSVIRDFGHLPDSTLIRIFNDGSANNGSTLQIFEGLQDSATRQQNMDRISQSTKTIPADILEEMAESDRIRSIDDFLAITEELATAGSDSEKRLVWQLRK